ncbi:MAG: ASKHA domain-containing protein, partial [Pseudomonadota bacterium]
TALLEYLESKYGLQDLNIDLSAQRKLPEVLRENEWQAQIALRDREIIMAGQTGKQLLGLAVDLGTTKIAAYLADLETGEILAAKAVVNRQMAYGQDLMARLNHAMEKKADALRQAAADDINQLVNELCTETGLSDNQIVEAVVVGNTAMHHLFLGLPVRQLALAPYIPAVSDAIDIKARDISLTLAPGAYVHLLPNIAGFVGADHVAVLLATGIYNTDKTTIGIDIGTNTEISLAVNNRLLSTSCASGPAFEGAHIKYGMRAEGGAVEKVKISGSSVEIRTINNEPPVGICGSGILDAIAQLRKAGIIDRMGKMLAHPLVRDGEKGQEFVLVYAKESGTGNDITITETDISEILMAKAAIAAALNILLEETKITWDDIDKILIAGAFGSYIDVASAIDIGMFADVPMNRFSQIGNAAGTGAKLALLSKEQRELSMAIARKANYIELTNHPQYLRKFSRAIRLPV